MLQRNAESMTNTTPHFNAEQRNVIEADSGTHLVLAPPGCGKTAVLAERLMRARARGISADDMACLTFTNRASRGMKERIDALTSADKGLTEAAATPFVGNVHRFCSQFLFDNEVVADDTAIIDTDVSMSIIADYMEEDELKILGEARQRQRYSQIINLQHLMYQCRVGHPSRLMVHRNAIQAQALRELCLVFSLPYSQESTIHLYLHAADYKDQPVVMSAEARSLIISLYAAHCYETYKQEHRLIDFEDLLLLTYDHLVAAKREGTPTKTLRWIQVDEVQDLNPLQIAIIDLFTAPDANVVYLGDPQQAIFSFMGAKMDTLNMLRQRCGDQNLHNFFVNYRSPRYLLNIYNRYATQMLGIAPQLLPQTNNDSPCQRGYVQHVACDNNVEEYAETARIVGNLYAENPQETTAVIVAFNSDADDVSRSLTMPHFKISGVDLFTTPGMRLLLAHLAVLTQENNFIEWARIFMGLHLFDNHSAARRFMHQLMSRAVTPVDFLQYEGRSTYLGTFVEAYMKRDLVIFDTETTGLDIFEDDVVQIAAVRVRQGQVVDELNLFIETDREIPAMLGDIDNPLVAAYAQNEHLTHGEALRAFADFARDCVIIGHNVEYDYHIMDNNMRRYAPEMSMSALWPEYFDSLKLIRLVEPGMRSYKLKNLIPALGLQGQNSHLANDDIMATLSLVNYCWREGNGIAADQPSLLRKHAQLTERFRRLYGPLYSRARALLYTRSPQSDIVSELRHVYESLLADHRIAEIPKLHYVLDYIAQDIAPQGASLIEQLSRHMQELSTLKEADLCGASSMSERVFVTTVHKAKGLEFDNVIVFDAVVGKYPSTYATSEEAHNEEARKFYVAISRAKKRLIVTSSRQYISPWGRIYPRELTPYMQPIRDLFD